MATQIPTELESFHRFLTEQLRSGGSDLSPEKSLEAFRAYQRDVSPKTSNQVAGSLRKNA